jgi:hypothetical protein
MEKNAEIALMDFVWDSEQKALYRSAWWWDESCRYCLPKNMVNIFLDAPGAKKGSFRISYANLHLAERFPRQFDAIVNPRSIWLKQNPIIHVWLELCHRTATLRYLVSHF